MSGKSKKGEAGEPADTSAMYVELSKLQQCGDYEKAIRQCNKIMNVNPQDATAFHCKMVNMLHLAKFSDVLHQIQTCHLSESVDLSFEEAYCLYRDNRCAEALNALDKNKGQSIKHKELRAQILYRLEKYKECMTVYRDIIKNSDVGDDFEIERMTNLAAVVVHLNAQGEKHIVPENEETYEMVYNKACCLLANGEFEEAEQLLKDAEKLCIEYLKEDQEDIEQEEIEQETGIIRAQRAYAIQCQSETREKESQAIYNSVLKSKPSDIGLVAVASNNLIVINKDQNIFDSKKKIKAATVEGLEHKLTAKHQSDIAKNNALLAMYTNQVSLCQDLVSDLVAKGTISRDEADMILAGAFSRSGKTKDAVDLVLKERNIGRSLIAAQICLENNDLAEGLRILDNLPDVEKFRAGILSAMVTLCLALDNRAKAADLLKAAVKKSKKGGDMSIVWRKTAEFHLKGDEPSVAAQSLESLLKMEPSNIQTLAQLVLAYAKFDLSKALDVSKKLPSFATDDIIDIEALEESSFVSTKYAKSKKPDPTSPKARETVKTDKKKKQKRKKRLPKNLNAELDPERWIPRRERTGYRKPRKNRRKDEKFTGAQGVAAGAAEAYDYSQKKPTASPQPGKASTAEAPPGPRQQQWKPQVKKKKNKRKY